MNTKIKKKKKFLKLNKMKIQSKYEDSDKCQETGKESTSQQLIFKIEDHLFLSGYQGAKNRCILKEKNIKHIINLTAHKCSNVHEDLVTHSSFSFADHENFNLNDHLDSVIDIIQEKVEAKENVLVHCQKGISRAPSIIMGFLIKKRNFTYEQSLKYVQKKNPKSYPNWGFLVHLQNL